MFQMQLYVYVSIVAQATISTKRMEVDYEEEQIKCLHATYIYISLLPLLSPTLAFHPHITHPSNAATFCVGVEHSQNAFVPPPPA